MPKDVCLVMVRETSGQNGPGGAAEAHRRSAPPSFHPSAKPTNTTQTYSTNISTPYEKGDRVVCFVGWEKSRVRITLRTAVVLCVPHIHRPPCSMSSANSAPCSPPTVLPVHDESVRRRGSGLRPLFYSAPLF